MPPWILYLDQEITRRKRFHLILDPAGETVWRSRLAGEMFEWLDRESVTHYEVHTGNARYSLAVERLRNQKE